MKKTAFALLLAALGAGNAAAGIYDFSYIEGATNFLGIQAAETYDVAVFLPGDMFGGFNLKEINAVVNASTGVSNYKNPSLWVSTNLDLVDGKFTPDIASYDVEISSDGILNTALPEDYTITSDGVYVGYTLTVGKLTNGTKFPMGFDECTDPNAFFCRTSKTMPLWSNLASEGGWGAAVSVKLESDNVADRSVTIYSGPEILYSETGKAIDVSLTLSSFSKNAVTSVDVEYIFDGKEHTEHVDLAQEVPAGLGKKFGVDITLPAVDHRLSEKVTFKVVKVNGDANEAANAEKTVTVGVIPADQIPAHQTLIEEYTGTWCGWCTRGYAALEYIRENEPDFVVAAYHNGDPMAITNNYPFASQGYPSVSLDRYYGGDPYYGTGMYEGKIPIVEEVKALNADITPWSIEVSHSWTDDDTLEATAEFSNLVGFENDTYYIAYILVADGLSGKSSSWFQANYYYSEQPSNDNIPELNAFCKGGEYGKSKVGGLVFNDVVVSTTGIYGVEGSVPASLDADQKASHSISFDLSTISENLIPDRNKLRVIAAVLDRNGVVLNCAKNEVNDYVATGVEGIETDENAPVEYYNLNGVKVAEPTQGIYIRKQGKQTRKIVVR